MNRRWFLKGLLATPFVALFSPFKAKAAEPPLYQMWFPPEPVNCRCATIEFAKINGSIVDIEAAEEFEVGDMVSINDDGKAIKGRARQHREDMDEILYGRVLKFSDF